MTETMNAEEESIYDEDALCIECGAAVDLQLDADDELCQACVNAALY
jgi:hypothetical protein